MARRVVRTRRMREAMVLVREVHEIGVGSEAARQHLLGGLIRAVGAAVGGTVLDTKFAPGMERGVVAATMVNFDRETIQVFTAHQNRGSEFNPYHRALMRRTVKGAAGEAHTQRNDDLVAPDEWERSEWINDYVRPVRLDHFLESHWVLGATVGERMGFLRARGSRAFSEEDREILHLVHVGVGGHIFDDRSEAFPWAAKLPPRVRQTLDTLLTGASDKEIAARLGLSPHTVRDYIKAIFKAYRVSSRVELIARFAGARRR
jgi:DNA-binding CsgD family transcriptional regulator